MNTGRWLLVGLLALNLGLGGALWLRSGGNTVFAQAGRGRGSNYLVVSGHANNKGVLFILDTGTGRMAVGELDHEVQPALVQKAFVDTDVDFKRVTGGGK